MVSAIEIVELIQHIPARERYVKFLCSLATNAFKYGSLTERQEVAFQKAKNELTGVGFRK